MFKNVEPIDQKKHRELTFAPITNFSHAAGLNIVPISLSETGPASKYFPIVFLEKEPAMPHALLGLKEGSNEFVDEKGNWTAPYIPAHIRRYPFVLGQTQDPKEFAIMMDKDAPHFQQKGGVALFTPEGAPGNEMKQVIEFLNRFQKEMIQTQQFTQMLIDKEMLSSQQFEIQTPSNQKMRFAGFKTVNRKKLAEIDPETASAWVKNGLLEAVYAHLNSLPNIQFIAKNLPANQAVAS